MTYGNGGRDRERQSKKRDIAEVKASDLVTAWIGSMKTGKVSRTGDKNWTDHCAIDGDRQHGHVPEGGCGKLIGSQGTDKFSSVQVVREVDFGDQFLVQREGYAQWRLVLLGSLQTSC